MFKLSVCNYSSLSTLLLSLVQLNGFPFKIYLDIPVLAWTRGPGGQAHYCRTPDLPNSPVQSLIGKSGRPYILVNVCLLFVATLVATLVITASSHSKCCPSDQTRPNVQDDQDYQDYQDDHNDLDDQDYQDYQDYQDDQKGDQNQEGNKNQGDKNQGDKNQEKDQIKKETKIKILF